MVGTPMDTGENYVLPWFWWGTEKRMAEREGFEPSIELLTL